MYNSGMEHSIVVSEALFAALQHRARREQKPVDRLAADWLTQHLDLTSYPELESREGPGGWRVIAADAEPVPDAIGRGCSRHRALPGRL